MDNNSGVDGTAVNGQKPPNVDDPANIADTAERHQERI